MRRQVLKEEQGSEERLAALAVGIRAALGTSTEAAVQAGKMLIEAKDILDHGAWLPWLRVNVEISERTAQDYMRLARSPNPQRAADLSIRSALAAARVEKQAAQSGRPERRNGPVIILRTHDGREVEYPAPTSLPMFNSTNDHIGWAAWSWNPVTGCLHPCPYCYAREIAMSATTRAHFPAGFLPLFHPERLTAPANTKVPAGAAQDPRLGRCFVGSMADQYGKWVPAEWIIAIHEAMVANPQWQYLLLTKFPRRYLEFVLPATAWVGTSVDDQKRVRLAEDAFRQIDGVYIKYLSLEPFKPPLRFTDLSMFDWLIVGAQTATRQADGIVPAYAPPFEEVAYLVAQAREAGCKVWMKENLLGEVNSQRPGMLMPQENPEPRAPSNSAASMRIVP